MKNLKRGAEIERASIVGKSLPRDERQWIKEQQRQQRRRRHDPKPAEFVLGPRLADRDRTRHWNLPAGGSHRSARNRHRAATRSSAESLAAASSRRARACRRFRARGASTRLANAPL